MFGPILFPPEVLVSEDITLGLWASDSIAYMSKNC